MSLKDYKMEEQTEPNMASEIDSHLYTKHLCVFYILAGTNLEVKQKVALQTIYKH